MYGFFFLSVYFEEATLRTFTFLNAKILKENVIQHTYQKQNAKILKGQMVNSYANITKDFLRKTENADDFVQYMEFPT